MTQQTEDNIIAVQYDNQNPNIWYHIPDIDIKLKYKPAPQPNKYSRGLTLTGFAIFIQFLSGRTPAVEASNGVTAESLTASISLLTFIHIWQGEIRTKLILQSLKPQPRTKIWKNKELLQ